MADGQPFTLADVKATFDRVLSSKVKSPRCGSMLKPVVASSEAIDAHTFQVVLKFPAAPFLEYTASAW